MEIIPLASSDGTVHLIVLILSTIIGRLIFGEHMNLFSGLALVFCSIGCCMTIYGLYNNMEEMSGQNDTATEIIVSHSNITSIGNFGNTTVDVDMYDSPGYEAAHRHIYTDTTKLFVIGMLVCTLEAVSEFIVFSLIKTIKDKIDNNHLHSILASSYISNCFNRINDMF